MISLNESLLVLVSIFVLVSVLVIVADVSWFAVSGSVSVSFV